MEATATSPATAGGDAATAAVEKVSQFLSFTLGREEYGVAILRVREIRGWQAVTRVPNAPPHMLGVLNLRGTIVPIVDMRVRFRLAGVEYAPTTVIIVLSVHGPRGSHEFGIVVDSVSDVLGVKAEDVKPTPDFGAAVSTDFLSGVATVGGRMLMLLDVDMLLGAEELSALAAASGH